jgi:protein arginine kinase
MPSIRRLGYLTACPTNLGTGMRASVMLHLPALVLTDQVSQVMKAVTRSALLCEALYGEGTDALGNLFQISNQSTLGEKESDIISRSRRSSRACSNPKSRLHACKLREDNFTMLSDQVGRAYAILQIRAHLSVRRRH